MMIEKSGKNDPELNEILGSIRRIISEDNAHPNARPVNAGAPLDDDEEILDLTEEVAVDVADDGRPEPLLGSVADEAPESEYRPEPILGMYSPKRAATEVELEEFEQPESPVREFPAPTRQAMTEPPEEPALPEEFSSPEEPAPNPGFAERMQESETPVDPEPSFQPAPVFAGQPVHKIVSETATTAAATALGELTRAMDEKTNKLKVGAGDNSVSDIVKEMLRPMLREWLDENLPGIVERIVRREIEKLVDRAETED